MYSIRDTKPRKLTYASTINAQLLSEIEQKSAETAFWEYHKLFIEDCAAAHTKIDFETMWAKWTVPQKALCTLGHFIGQVNNGGVWQFLFNRPLFAFAAYEIMDELGYWSYVNIQKEFLALIETDKYAEIIRIWNDEALPFEERWAAFQSGYELLPAGKSFETDFYEEKYKARFYEKAVQYIRKNLHLLVEIEKAQSAAKPKITAKNATEVFSEYLMQQYGLSPTEIAVYYRCAVTIDNEAVNLFLIKYSLPTGKTSLGITGHFTLDLPEMDWTDVKEMHQKNHKQELINFFFGAYLIQETLKENPAASTIIEAEKKAILEKLQAREKSQIPVNLHNWNYIRCKGKPYYTCVGDLLYNDNKDLLPEDINAPIPIVSVNAKPAPDRKITLHGEENRMFLFEDTAGFARSSDGLCRKYPLIFWVGKRNKIIKDNPWGF